MELFNFDQGPIRPPSEADSLLIRTTEGCPWNKCTFCTLFKGMEFSIRPVEEIKQDIWNARRFYKDRVFETCFLQDGDSFAMETEDLLDVLTTLKEAFPELKRISSYGRAQTMRKKSAEEMKAICDAGLNMLYCGMESGSVDVLKRVKKGITPNYIVSSAKHAKKAGMEIMVFIILGLGGKELSHLHVAETAKILNEINPDEIRLLSLAVKPNTELMTSVEQGKFTMLSELEMVEEQRQLLALLDNIDSKYGNFHGINLLMEINGKLPEDKDKFLGIMDNFIALPRLEQMNFILGRRRNYYRQLSDLQPSFMYDLIKQDIDKIQRADPNAFESIFHSFRQQMI
ncbi:radical SAM protein [Vibrio maerlii]|uniref:radical SAM protein n=1 Tax=Vibrio maerlii TaxID=2231648 RepID=UPI0019CFF258|nr:radical SAM protein [Vibrio maerlii]